MTVEKKSVGRPKKYSGKRPTWTIRLEEKYGDQIKALAEKTGRSISEVCERQIVDAFRMEIMLDLLETRCREIEASRDSLMLRVEELASLLAASEEKRGQRAFAEIEKIIGGKQHLRSVAPRRFGRLVRLKQRRGRARGST